MSLVFLVILIGLFAFYSTYLLSRMSFKTLWQKHRESVTMLLIIMFFLLAITGRLAFLLPLFGMIMAMIFRLSPLAIRYAPLLQRLWQHHQNSQRTRSQQAGVSRVETRFVRMQLNQNSGEISGEVLEGRFSGRRLVDLTQAEVLQLYQECRSDKESQELLDVYARRVFGDQWQGHNRQEQASGERSTAHSGGKMTVNEAFEILGLPVGASKQDIIDAHRRLMQKVHPDRGGSSYLAAKINIAKDLLMK